VNLASRICDAAEVGHPLTSEQLRDLGLERGFSFDAGREIELKGFPRPTRVFELLARNP
jgi:class 3 adenylate cyclase